LLPDRSAGDNGDASCCRIPIGSLLTGRRATRDYHRDHHPDAVLPRRTLEQTLVINVAREVLGFIVGCGHQGLPRLLTRVKTLVATPLYGIVGGLGGRLELAVSGRRRLVVSCSSSLMPAGS
jgi:hypothetical protein